MKSAAGVFIQPIEDAVTAGLPIRERVAHSIRAAVASGALARGDRLPSSRQLARDWQVSRGAVDEAFADLEIEGLIERHVGDGSYVRRQVPDPPAVLRQALPHAQRVLRHRLLQGCGLSRLESAQRPVRTPDMHPRSCDIDSFAIDTWRRLTLASYDEGGQALRSSVPAGGLPALREAIARHLAVHRGVVCTPEQVLVTAGAGENMLLLGRLLLQPGDRMWLEDPSHPSLSLLMRALGIDVVGVPLDAMGLDVAAGLRLAPRAALCYLHPLNQYPLGIRTAPERLDALLRWAESTGAWLVEGHMNDEMVPQSQQPQSLLARDKGERVLMCGTFEGVVFPSLRVGYLVLPRSLAADFVTAAVALGEQVPGPVQWTLAQFIARGHLSARLQDLRARLTWRRQIVRQTLLAELPPAVRAGPMNTGAHLCLHLPDVLPDTEVMDLLRPQRVIVEALSLMQAQSLSLSQSPSQSAAPSKLQTKAQTTVQSPRLNGIVLGYGGLPADELQTKLRVIVRTLATCCAAAYQPTGENA